MHNTSYKLSNELISLTLDEAGGLTGLVNHRTGHNYLQMQGLPPWRMFYRTGGGVEQNQVIDLEVSPSHQHAAITASDQEITLSYESLYANSQHLLKKTELDVRLVVRIKMKGDMLCFSAEIANKTAGIEITEIWLPWVYNIGHMGLGRPADTLYWPECAGRRIHDPYARLSSAWDSGALPTHSTGPSWYRLTYPFPASMQWFTLNNGEEGLYLGSHDSTLMTTCLNVMAHEDDVGALSASIIKYPFVKCGETWISEPAVLRIYCGNWHKAAHTYRSWADTWMKPPSPPDWLRHSVGWIKPFLKDQSGHIRGSYSDLPEMHRKARQIGINVLNCFGWVREGFDNRYPQYNIDDALGGRNALEQALNEIKEAGGRTILYTQGQLIDPTTEFYRAKGNRITAKDIWGYEYREQYSFYEEGSLLQTMRSKVFGIACPSACEWIDQLQAQFEMVKEYGAQGILFDQMGGTPPYICFSETHNHSKPSLAAGPGKVRNMKRLREMIKKRDPEFAFVIELATDCYCEYVDIIHSHGTGFWPGPEAFGEMFRYTFPEPVVTNRIEEQHRRKMYFGYAFSLGLRLDTDTSDAEEPETAAYLSRLCELYTAGDCLLMDGRFIDTEGFTCDNECVSTHAFLGEGRLAVTIWNPGDQQQYFRISVPGYVLEQALWQEPGMFGCEHAILPGDAALQIFRKLE